MPINQPPISDDPVKASWDFETTNMVNLLEEKNENLCNKF